MGEFRENDLPEELLSQKPREPSASECCGSGCQTCVYDIYDQELSIWKKQCVKVLGKDSEDCPDDDKYAVISPDEYSKFVLSDIIYQTRNCNLYRFAIPKNGSLNLKLGQHIILRGKVNDSTIFRQYTPISQTNSKGYFNVIIKLYDGGLMSKVVSNWHCGIEAEWRGPFGSFEYVANSFHRLILIAGGTGIAPMVQIIRNILDNEQDETLVHLIYACKTYEDILLKPMINEFKQFWNFRATYYLSQETKDKSDRTQHYGDDIEYGRIDQTALQSKLPTPSGTKALICGPNSFNSCMKMYLKSTGFSDSQYLVF